MGSNKRSEKPGGTADAGQSPKKQAYGTLLKGVLAVVAWLAIWQLVAMAIANPWLLSTPIETLGAWAGLALTPDFWLAVLRSLGRIALGFLIAFVLGIVAGYLASKLPGLRIFLKPAVLAIKSAPVVCIIALLLVAVGSDAATAIVVGLVVFPQFYHAILESAQNQDAEVDKVLDLFGVPFARRALCVDLVAFATSIRAAMATAAGLAWKSGVAAELIGLPGLSIGEGVYLAKISLDSASIIAWTATVILLSWISEKLLLALTDTGIKLPARWLKRRVKRVLKSPALATDISTGLGASSLTIDEAERDFGHEDGIERLHYEHIRVPAGGRLCVMAPSGSGKSTLLRLVAGIDTASRGSVLLEGGHACVVSLMMQDSTLVPWASALENIAIVAADEREIRMAYELLCEVLGVEDLAKPVYGLSGGMRRRAELCRALAHPSTIVLLDEPFSGLDLETKERCIKLIDRAIEDRTLIVATHDSTDAEALHAQVLQL